MVQKADREQTMRYPRYALMSVSNKTGIENLARALNDIGYEILSSGGTGQALNDSGIPFTDVRDLTGCDPILDGVVKSLHPQIIGGIAAKDTPGHFDELTNIKSSYIDIVICNVGPITKTKAIPNTPLNELMAKIDIGGPTLLKTAARNFERVTVMCDPEKYNDLLWFLASEGEVPMATRFEWAKEAFKHVMTYDSTIYSALLEYDLATGKG